MRIPDTLYAMAGDAAIAYQVYGSGEHRVVWVPGMVSNVEVMWEWPPHDHWFERWGSFATVVALDKRGTGCSDRVEVPASLEARMEDFNARFGHSVCCCCFVASGGRRGSERRFLDERVIAGRRTPRAVPRRRVAVSSQAAKWPPLSTSLK